MGTRSRTKASRSASERFFPVRDWAAVRKEQREEEVSRAELLRASFANLPGADTSQFSVTSDKSRVADEISLIDRARMLEPAA